MPTADQDDDTSDPKPADAPREHPDDGSVSDGGGDSDPAAAATSSPAGEGAARQAREDESPS